jgi:transposase InsO family protein
MAEAVLEENRGKSRPTQDRIIDIVNARVSEDVDPERVSEDADPERVSEDADPVVTVPSRSAARKALTEISKGTYAFKGATRRKREAALRPVLPYSSLRPTHPGQYLVLDSTRLDVFAMCPLTLRWISLELSAAMDLYSRSIAAIRLSASTKQIDAALLIYEAITPDSWALSDSGLLNYVGCPDVLVVDDDKLAGRTSLPGVAAETCIVDHGKQYFSPHTFATCERLDMSVQPARKATPTDKAPLERFFRTIREDLLVALPGYKGPDVYSRGENPEDEAFYFVFELEQMIRDWIARRYHTRTHDGCNEPLVPGLEMTPLDALRMGRARVGELRIPARPDMVYDFLPTEWRTIQHYGVEMNGQRYDGPGIRRYKNKTSSYQGRYAGKWPFRYDPDDITRIFFQDVETLEWHELRWNIASDIKGPFSREVVDYARKLAVSKGYERDDRSALLELLQEWEAGRFASRTERRLALRLSTQRAKRFEADAEEPSSASAEVIPLSAAAQAGEPPDGGDDDLDEDVSHDFYGDAFENLG